MCQCERVFHLSSGEIRATESVTTHGLVCPTVQQPFVFPVSLWAFLFSVVPTLSFQGQSQKNQGDANRPNPVTSEELMIFGPWQGPPPWTLLT